MPDDVGARRAVAGDDVDDARGQAHLDADFGEGQSRQRGEFGGLQHHRIARGQCGRDLPGEHQQREIPRNDLPADADRPLPRKFACHQRGPAGVMIEMPRDQRHVDVAGFADRLAIVDGFEHAEKPFAFLHMPRERVEMTRPFVARQRRPRGQRLARGGNGGVDVGLRALRHARDRLALGGIEDVEQFAGLGEAARDEMAEAGTVRGEPAAHGVVVLGRGAVIQRHHEVGDLVHGPIPSRGDSSRNSGRSPNVRADVRCR